MTLDPEEQRKTGDADPPGADPSQDAPEAPEAPGGSGAPGGSVTGHGRTPHTIRYVARSDRGLVRATNQDSVYAGDRILVIADGMGGHAAGDTASRLVVAAFAPLDSKPPQQDLLSALRDATLDGNVAIAETVAEHPELDGMGTTLTALYFDGSRLAMAHVGDSRAYLYRSGVLHQLTHDDTFVQSLVDDGRITEEEAIHHPQRNLLLRALNGTELEPGLTQREARAGDRYLICSDGLCGVVSAEAIADALTEPDPDRAADLLVELALVGGGPDNVTVIVADVIDTGSPATERIPPVVIDPDATGPIGQMTREMPRVPLPPIPEEPGAPTRYAAGAGQDGLDGETDEDLDDLDDDDDDGDIAAADSDGSDAADVGDLAGQDAMVGPENRTGWWRGRRAAPADPGSPAAQRRRWRKRGAFTLAVLALLLVAVGGSGLWVSSQYFVGARGDMVGVYRGVNGSLLGVQFSTFQEDSCAGAQPCTPIKLSDLQPAARVQVQAGIQANSLADARAVMGRLAGRLLPPCTSSATGTGGGGENAGGAGSATAAATTATATTSVPTAQSYSSPTSSGSATGGQYGAQATWPDSARGKQEGRVVTVTVGGTAAPMPPTPVVTVTVQPAPATATEITVITPPTAGLFDSAVQRALAAPAPTTTTSRPSIRITTVGAKPAGTAAAIGTKTAAPKTTSATTTGVKTTGVKTTITVPSTTSPTTVAAAPDPALAPSTAGSRTTAPTTSEPTLTETVTAQTPTVTVTQTQVSTPSVTATPLAPAIETPGVTCRVVG